MLWPPGLNFLSGKGFIVVQLQTLHAYVPPRGACNCRSTTLELGMLHLAMDQEENPALHFLLQPPHS